MEVNRGRGSAEQPGLNSPSELTKNHAKEPANTHVKQDFAAVLEAKQMVPAHLATTALKAARQPAGLRVKKTKRRGAIGPEAEELDTSVVHEALGHGEYSSQLSNRVQGEVQGAVVLSALSRQRDKGEDDEET